MAASNASHQLPALASPSGSGFAATHWASPRLLLMIALIFGVGMRLLQYGANRSLWLDEVLMVPGIVEPSLMELLHPASWRHLPPGFLLLEKLAVLGLGNQEYALRLVPLLAGLAALFGFVALAKRSLPAGAVPVAVGLFACSPFLIYYSSELKPYSSDAAVSVLLLLLGLQLQQKGVTARRAALWGLAVVLAAGFSLVSVFIAGGVTLALLAAAWSSRDRAALHALLLVLGAWAVVFGVPYLLFLHGSATDEYARAFWRSGFMPVPPRSLGDLVWLPRMLFRVFQDPLGVLADEPGRLSAISAAAGMAAFAAGCAGMAARDRGRLWLLVSPVLVTLVASALMLYPFGGNRVAAGRVLLFLAPIFFLLMAEGVAYLWDRLRGQLQLVPLALVALVLFPLVSWGMVAVPLPRTEVKPLLGYLEEQARPGDVLYVHYDTRHAFEYYAGRYRLAGVDDRRGVCARGEPGRYLEALAALQGAPRVWVLFGNGQGAGWFDEKRIMLDYLEHSGTRLDDQVSHGASLYLYDLRPAEAAGSPYRVELPAVEASLADGCALWS